MTKGVNSTGISVSGRTGMVSYKRYVIADGYGTAIAGGDPVSLLAGNVIACPETAKPIGILRGIEYINAAGEWTIAPNFTAGTTNAGTLEFGRFGTVVALVQPVDDQVFAMEASTTLTQANVGTKYRLSGTGAAAARSTAVIAVASAVTAEIRLVEVMGLLEKPGNAYGATGVDVLVKFV